MSDPNRTSEQPEDPVGFDGACGLAVAFGRRDRGHPRWRRTIDGTQVQFQSGSVRAASYLFTGRIRRALAAEGA